MTPIRVLIADDHTLFRQGICSLLDPLDNIEVVGQAVDGQDVIDQAATLDPDVILMDIHMPAVHGIDATRTILQQNAEIGILMVTMFEDDASVFAAMRAGARGYILKGADQDEMVRAISAVANGEALFGPRIAQRVARYFAAQATYISPNKELLPELTPREREVLQLIVSGLKNADIAEKLVISHKTVRNHISSIFSKLQVSDRMQAIHRARQAGMTDA